ncbi:MAG: chalcone isomerase family protein [Roseibium sp.]
MSFHSILAVTRNTAVALLIMVTFALPFGINPAHADLGAAANSVPAASLVGKGRMTFLGFKIFDAELYAPGGAYSASKPFALKLTYLRNFKGVDIAKRSASEIKKLGNVSKAKLVSWTRQMETIFPNVSPGQSITGVRTATGGTRFYFENRNIGTIKDPAFSRNFFNIWLGNSTSNPRLRARLVGAGS